MLVSSSTFHTLEERSRKRSILNPKDILVRKLYKLRVEAKGQISRFSSHGGKPFDPSGHTVLLEVLSHATVVDADLQSCNDF